MRKREAIEPRKPEEAEADALTVAAGSNAQTRDKDAQVPPWSKSVASVQGSSSVTERKPCHAIRLTIKSQALKAEKF